MDACDFDIRVAVNYCSPSIINIYFCIASFILEVLICFGRKKINIARLFIYSILEGVISTLLILYSPNYGLIFFYWVMRIIYVIYLLSLGSAKMRNWYFRWLICIPGNLYFGIILLDIFILPALPYIKNEIGSTILYCIPVIIAYAGVFQAAFTHKFEQVNMIFDDKYYHKLQRLAKLPDHLDNTQPLRIMQITDTHLGAFMPISRLRLICENVVKENPDLVFLTGDFFTVDTAKATGALSQALAPLKAISHKTFACLGNHDYEECYDTLISELNACNIKLLVDEEVIVQTVIGKVQIVGLDFKYRGKKAYIENTCNKIVKADNIALRILLIHDPMAFKYVPTDEQSLVFSGHTHGGICGCVSCGLDCTVIGLFIPDHGFWAHGKNRLYVHRGTGQYGFPVRLGVPNENSLLNIYVNHKNNITNV